eukprot:3667673-Amphidinium_carterae.1
MKRYLPVEMVSSSAGLADYTLIFVSGSANMRPCGTQANLCANTRHALLYNAEVHNSSAVLLGSTRLLLQGIKQCFGISHKRLAGSLGQVSLRRQRHSVALQALSSHA